MADRLRTLARRLRLRPGALRSDLPEALGIPSLVPPDPERHWRRVLGRSRSILRELPSAGRPRVALITTIGKGPNNPGYAAVMAYALRLRGADPFMVYCDAALDGCELPTIHHLRPREFIEVGPRPLCRSCFIPGQELYKAIGLPTHRLTEFLGPDGLAEAARSAARIPRERYYDFMHKGMPLGPQVEATVGRFFYTHAPAGTETTWRVAERMVRTAIQTTDAGLRMVERLDPDVLLVNYGAYSSRGPFPAVAHSTGRRCVVWSRGYVEEVVMLGEGENAFMDIAGRTEGLWETVEMGEERSTSLDDLLDRRAEGIGTYKISNPGALTNQLDLVRSLDLDPGRPIVALYTNVGFDTKLFYDTPLYPNVISWIIDSIRIFAGRKEQLVIRVHPGELWLPEIDKEQTLRAIRDAFPELPANVRIVPPESRLSSYALGRISVASLVYGSMIGLELAAIGKPVIVCGRGVYWRKGFTYDVVEPGDYERFVRDIEHIARPDKRRAENARRFAFYFYFLKQLPFRHWNHDVHPGLKLRPWWKVFRSLDDLRPGRDPDLDAICDQVMTGSEALAHPEPGARARAGSGSLAGSRAEFLSQ